jgi:hypothetical protein
MVNAERATCGIIDLGEWRRADFRQSERCPAPARTRASAFPEGKLIEMRRVSTGSAQPEAMGLLRRMFNNW